MIFRNSILFDSFLFIVCARMLTRTKIAEVVYQDEHSNGYGKDILEKAGKRVRKLK